MFKRTQSGDAPVLRCSFCRKSHDDVRKLVAGPSVNICDECVEVCSEIVHEDSRLGAPPQMEDGAIAKDTPRVAVSGPAVRCALCRMPSPVEDGLLIRNRGVLCPGCIGEIEAAVAESREAER